MNIPDTVGLLSSTSQPLLPDRAWHVDMLIGNVAMAHGHLPDSEQAYLRSIERADLLLDVAHQQLNNAQLETIHLYLISCTNLGNLYQQWQRWDRAEAILLKGHQRTISILQASDLPEAIRWQAMLALQKLTIQMSSFYGDLDRSGRSIAKRMRAVLPDNTCLLIGDNSTASTDSRHFGSIPLDRIVGKVTSQFSR